MARQIDFRHHPDAARCGVSHHLLHLFAGIELAVAGQLLQFGVALRGKAPALVVGQMPMEDIEFGRRHAVELAQDIRQRQEMARRIQQHAAPRETRHVGNRHQRQEGVLAVGLHQLQQGFHAAQRAEAGIGGQCGALRRHRQLVAFIAAGQRLSGHFVFDIHLNRRTLGFCGLRRQRPTGLQFDALPPAQFRLCQIVALHLKREAVIQHQPARRLRQFDLLWPRHQRQRAGRLRQRAEGKQ
ncbi:Uncharacterised protein [Serratia plymuthica]|uniref:Uncharacterized protein n=1 Tax=Serratia plymuthica TaxID=82996 RepID=A0A2X4UCF0_SERPL|nr:Uncharacterised protein [Serratia plymuthica]